MLLELTLGARAEVLLSDDVEGPATVGVRRATILVPRRILDPPLAVQTAVLCHELLHVRRRDWLVTLAEELWCALLWFHPGARLIASRACLARETLVDEAVTLPQVLHEVKPVYTPQAMQQKIQGSVWLRIVVLANGNVGDVEVTRSLDQEFGLDNQAISAARQWRFKPGTKNGRPVPVRVTLELTFTSGSCVECQV